MENAIYYTLSTVAQTFAAGFALIAAFALFRLESWEGQLESAKNELFMDFPDENHQLFKLLEQGDVRAVDKALTEEEKKKATSIWEKDHFFGPAPTMARLYPAKKILKTRMLESMYINAFTIMVSIAALPFAPLLDQRPMTSWVLLVVVVTFALLAIISLGRLIISALKGAPSMIEQFFPNKVKDR